MDSQFGNVYVQKKKTSCEALYPNKFNETSHWMSRASNKDAYRFIFNEAVICSLINAVVVF